MTISRYTALIFILGCGQPNIALPPSTSSKFTERNVTQIERQPLTSNTTSASTSATTVTAPAEWRFDTAATGKGSSVLTIGLPRLRIGQPTFTNELRGERFVGFDGEAFRVWDTNSGLEIARLTLPQHEWVHLYEPLVLHVTAGARAVLGGFFDQPQQWTTPYRGSRALATDRHLIGTLADGTVVVANKTQKSFERRVLDTDELIASVPARVRVVGTVAQIGEDLFMFESASVFRWNKAGNTLQSIAKAPHEWSDAQVRDGAQFAVAWGTTGVDRINLVDGVVTPVPAVTAVECLLPADTLVYAAHADLVTIDLRTFARGITMRAAASVEKLVCGDNGSFAYLTNHEIHMVDASGTERPMSTPARFAGWGTHGTVLVDDHGTSTIDLATRVATPGGTSVAAPTPTVTTTVEARKVVVRAGGVTRATLHIKSRPGDPDLYERRYLAAAADDKHVVVVWYQPDLERYGRLGSDNDQEEGAQYCAENDREARCVMEYFVEVWTVAAQPRRLWTTRLDRAIPTKRPWPFPKEATAVALTHDGRGALLGFRDGDVIVADVATGAMHTESLHHAPVTRIELAPDDAYVLTQDLADEQRVWPLAY